MRSGTFVVPVFGRPTRLGRLTMAGEVVDDVPLVASPMRVMDDWILSYIHRGAGIYRFEDGREVPIGPGTVTLVPPSRPHWYGTQRGERWSEVFAVFAGPLFSMLDEVKIIDAGPRRPSRVPSVSRLRTIITAAPQTRSEAEHQLIALAGWLTDVASPEESAGNAPSEPITSAARQLAADTTGALSMEQVAAAVGLEYDAFRRQFRAELGQAPANYRNTHRLQAAADLLRLTTLTVHDIAIRLGYVDEFHLSRRFKARFGVPPTVYRHR